MIVQRVEKHKITKSNPHYDMLDRFCYYAKNLYNHANYIVRNEFCKTNKWVRYNELDKILKSDKTYSDYVDMPTAQSAQQTLRLLDHNWCAFFKSIKDWSKHKDKYLGRPKLPKYKNKNGRSVLILTNQNVKLKNSKLQFPKIFNGFEIRPLCVNKDNFVSIQQVRFVPKLNYMILEVVYTVDVCDTRANNHRYISIDIGVDNLATITNNFGNRPFIVNGKGLKSENKYYNKLLAHYRSLSMQINSKYSTKRIQQITNKRNFIVDNYLHQASRLIVNYAKNNDVSVIVIGNNKEWKQNSKLSKIVNQTFVQIPFSRLIQMIEYKAQEIGISVILTEESYTSGTSFIDNEMPTKENYNKTRRVHRGLFKSNNSTIINADVNGSFQILKKVFPKAYDGIEVVSLQPFVVNACVV